MTRRILSVVAFCCGLAIGPVAHAAVYILLQNATVTNGVPPGPYVVLQTVTGGPIQNQAFEVTVSGSGTSCTVQLVGSNDAVNWIAYGSAITATGGSPQGASGTTPWAYFGAEITAISGPSARCTVTMSG